MTTHRRALVVAPSTGVAQPVAASLARAGFTPVVVREFAAARTAVDVEPPDLVVTEVKLGAYNGLHLAIRIRSRGSKMPVILVGDPDSVLKAEAERLDAVYLSTPPDEAALLAVIERLRPESRPLRRSARKRVPPLDALIDDIPVRVVDVSYEGLRFQTLHIEAAAMPADFVLSIPVLNVTCRAQRIWASASGGVDGTACGATVVSTDAAAVAWRALVDSVPEWTMLAY